MCVCVCVCVCSLFSSFFVSLSVLLCVCLSAKYDGIDSSGEVSLEVSALRHPARPGMIVSCFTLKVTEGSCTCMIPAEALTY